MFKFVLCLCICVTVVSTISALETVETYEARIYDYDPAHERTPQETLTANIRTLLTEIEKPGIDIMVFPEYGITGTEVFTQNVSAFAVRIPAADSSKSVCKGENVDQIVTDIACGLVPNRLKTLVVNLLEKENDEIYNTNVVFDGTGAILAKYRKINLNTEERRYLKAGKHVVTFTTSFGVTFGLITGDDILHNNPSQEIFKELAVTDVVMTSSWESEVPFFTSIGLQHGYAKKNGINFLVSSICDPEKYKGGSGIYNAVGSIKTVINAVRATQSGTASIKVINRRQPELACNEQHQPRGIIGVPAKIDSFRTKAMSAIEDYIYKPLLKQENTDNRFKDDFCNGGLCCKFTVEFNQNIFDIRPVYKAVVSGKSCGIIACDDNDDLSTCGSRNKELEQVTFNHIEIEATTKKAEQYLPVSSNLELKNVAYRYCGNGNGGSVRINGTSGLVYLGFVAETSAGYMLVNYGLISVVGVIVAVFNLV